MTETPEAEPGDQSAQRVERDEQAERVLEQSVERIETPREAHAVLTRLERLAAAQPPPPRPVGEAVAPPQPIVSPGAQRGRRLLREAMFRRMGPAHAIDVRVYLAINEAPHPPALDSFAWVLAIVTTGGWIWLLGALIAYLLRVPKALRALRRLLPGVVVATWLIEYPIKAYFQRRRPFVRNVEALVIGKRPSSWSFPSGHTGASFAGAWLLSSVWPKRSPVFLGLAALVGVSRVYVGAHYPGDVVVGAVLGVTLSEAVRRAVGRLFR